MARWTTICVSTTALTTNACCIFRAVRTKETRTNSANTRSGWKPARTSYRRTKRLRTTRTPTEMYLPEERAYMIYLWEEMLSPTPALGRAEFVRQWREQNATATE